MSDCDISPAKRRRLTGRARFSLGIINRLVVTGLIQDNKQISDTIEHVKSGLRSGVRAIINNDKSGEAARLLCRMALVYRLQDGKISFSSDKQLDFVDKVLCKLQPHPDDIHLVMDGPMVVEAVEEEFNVSNKDPAFVEHLDQFCRIVTNFGTVRRFSSDQVLQQPCPPEKKHKENDTSSDLHCCFLQKDGLTLSSPLADIRRAFENSGTPSNLKGILRIHVEFPSVKGQKPITHVKKDPTTGVEDVMVYIDLSNMDSFFDEGVAGDRDDMIRLKWLIRFVSSSA
ncbi:hypothetical protein BGZ47_001484 [Haplosporangium gracile]|nr:hypothetical protein BGZ47_001484 [Haplosporangium gracile]